MKKLALCQMPSHEVWMHGRFGIYNGNGGREYKYLFQETNSIPAYMV